MNRVLLLLCLVLLPAAAAAAPAAPADTAAAAGGPVTFKVLLFGGIALVLILIGAIVFLLVRIKRGKSAAATTVGDKLRPYIDREFIKEVRDAEERTKESFAFIKKAGDQINRLDFLQSYREKLAVRLLQAGLRIKPQEFIVINIFVTLIGGGLFFIISRTFYLMPVGFIISFFLPHFFLMFKKSSRVKLFNDQLVDGLTLMSNSLKAGYGFMQAVQLLAEESPDPLGEEFSRVVRENALGLTLEEALEGLVRRVESDDLDLCITAVLIQRQIGGNLSEILDSIAFTIRERIRLKGQIKTLTAQGRLGGIVIALLPIALGIVFAILQTEMMSLFVDSFLGRIMIGIGVFMQSLGAFAIKKVIEIEM